MQYRRLHPHSQNPYTESGAYSLVAIVAISIGTVISVMFVPDNLQDRGALQASAIIFAMALLIVPIMRIRRYASSFFYAENVVLFGIVYWLFLEPIQGSPMWSVSSESIVTLFTACGLFAAAVWVGVACNWLVLPKALGRAAAISITDLTLFKTIIIAFLLAIFYFAYSCNFDLALMIDSLGAERFSAPWSRGQYGDVTALIEQLYNFGYIVPSLVVLLAHRKGWLHAQVIIGVILAVVIILFLAQGGGRRVIGVALGSAVICWIFLQARISAKMILVAAMSLAAVLTMMTIMFEYRKVGLKYYVDKSDLSSENPAKSHVFINVDNNMYWFARQIQMIPSVVPYVGIQPIVYNLVKPVPRVFWPGKPADAGYDLARLSGEKGLSLTTSIVGEFYAVYGFIAVFLGGLVFGLLAGLWNRVLKFPPGDGKVITLGLGLMNLFAGMRGMQDLVLMSYGLLGWLVIASFIVRRRISRGVLINATGSSGFAVSGHHGPARIRSLSDQRKVR